MPKLNLPLALKVWDQITQHPETHDQEHFYLSPCTSREACCIVGWARELSSAEDLFPDEAATESGYRHLYYSLYDEYDNEAAKTKFRTYIDEELANA